MHFPDPERRFLLARPGIGPAVVARLEQAGYSSLSSIQASGVGTVIDAVVARVSSPAWLNRRHALERAIRAWHEVQR